jgi:hypothetical protein
MFEHPRLVILSNVSAAQEVEGLASALKGHGFSRAAKPLNTFQ